MSDDMMTVRTLPEKSSDADLLRDMIAFTAQRLMGPEVRSVTGARPWVRNKTVSRRSQIES